MSDVFDIDELRLYRGKDKDIIRITDKITVMQPTIDEIIDFGERRYWSAVQILTSVGADLKWQLWDEGIDYTKIDDFDLFKRMICRMVSSRKHIHKLLNENPEFAEQRKQMTDEDMNELLINPLSLVFKDLDLADFEEYESDKNTETILYNKELDITIDRFVYQKIVNVVRKIHGFKRNNQIPANEITKMDLIEDARDEHMMAMNKPYRSVLLPLVSFLEAKTGQLGTDAIYNMTIYKFFYAIKRISKIQDAELLLQGAYSGFANLKDVSKDRLDCMAYI